MNESDRKLEDNYTGKPIAIIIGALFILSAFVVSLTKLFFVVVEIVKNIVK